MKKINLGRLSFLYSITCLLVCLLVMGGIPLKSVQAQEVCVPRFVEENTSIRGLWMPMSRGVFTNAPCLGGTFVEVIPQGTSVTLTGWGLFDEDDNIWTEINYVSNGQLKSGWIFDPTN